jgi:hypothetical protein
MAVLSVMSTIFLPLVRGSSRPAERVLAAPARLPRSPAACAARGKPAASRQIEPRAPPGERATRAPPAAAQTFIAGIYGTNFDNLPELHWELGYAYFYAVCVFATVIMCVFMLKLGLIGSTRSWHSA